MRIAIIFVFAFGKKKVAPLCPRRRARHVLVRELTSARLLAHARTGIIALVPLWLQDVTEVLPFCFFRNSGVDCPPISWMRFFSGVLHRLRVPNQGVDPDLENSGVFDKKENADGKNNPKIKRQTKNGREQKTMERQRKWKWFALYLTIMQE